MLQLNPLLVQNGCFHAPYTIAGAKTLYIDYILYYSVGVHVTCTSWTLEENECPSTSHR